MTEPTDPTDAAPAAIDARKDAWKRTLGELERMAADLEDDGWDVVAVPVGHAAPEPPDAGDEDRFGFVHVVPGNYAPEFREAFDVGGFEQYNVFRQQVAGQVFFVLQLLDAETETAIMLAAQFSPHRAEALESAVDEAGVVYTHVQKLDGTHLGTYRHDDPERFFPD